MKKLGLILLLIFSINTFAQDSLKSESSGTFFNKKNISLIGLSSFFALSLVDSYYMWWKDSSEPFHFFNPPAYFGWFNEPSSLGIDRVGHFYTSYFFYHTQKNILLWGGHDEDFSRWFSAALTGGLAVLIEVGDGFSEYGFDPKDLVFNLGGVGYGILQDYVPFMRNFNFKWSFIPTDGFKFPPKFTEHYDSHIYWLTFDVHNIFEESVGNYWPKFIQPAIGFSVADNGSRREFVVGLDFNFNFLFEGADENWQILGKTLSMIHIVPAPGIKYSPSKKPEYRLLLFN